MKLFESLPEGVRVGKKYFKCDFDFRNVLKMLEIMQREDMVPAARVYHCVKCVISRRMTLKTASEAYNVLCDLLFGKPPETGAESGKKLTSFEQDAPLIRAAFRQVYHIDLYREKLTWFEFTELLQGLPEGNRYEDVIGIRARPIPAPTKYNAKEREWLMKAKQSVALHLTEAEAARKYDADVGRIFGGLMGMIKDGDKVGE